MKNNNNNNKKELRKQLLCGLIRLSLKNLQPCKKNKREREFPYLRYFPSLK